MKTFSKKLNTRGYRCLLTSNEKGYTLVELMVVMGIIAVILLLSSSSLYSSRKQAYLDASAKKLVSATREAMNNSLSVLPEQDGTGKSSSAWVMVVDKQDQTAILESYYFNDTAVVKSEKATEITFEGGSTLVHKFPKRYLHLVYSAPFGKFYGLSSDNPDINDWLYDSTTKERYPNLEASGVENITGSPSDFLSIELGANEVELNLDYGSGMLRAREFNASEFTLSMLSVGGTGILEASPSGSVHQYGTTVSVTATPSPVEGYTFANWSGCDSVSGNVCTISMVEDKTVTANFTPVSYTVSATVGSSSAGLGTVTGGGSYNYNTQATVTATPNAGQCFRRWWTADGVHYGNPYNFNVTKAINFVGYFNVPTAAPSSPPDNISISSGTNIIFTATSGNSGEIMQLRYRRWAMGAWQEWVTTEENLAVYAGTAINVGSTTLNASKIEWQVRSWNADFDCSGPWSTTRVINAT